MKRDTKNTWNLLDRAWEAYAKGEPFLSDEEFDSLAKTYKYEKFTEGTLSKKSNHTYRMYSLKKVFDEEPSPLPSGATVESPKLDGAAISLYYVEGLLVKGITRGDGIEGEDITDKVYLIETIPNTIRSKEPTQITGEIVVSKKIENARNFASGALHIKSVDEFVSEKAAHLIFVAYGVYPYCTESYKQDMLHLEDNNFITILDKQYCREFFRNDGTVIRLDDNNLFENLGYTAKHPKGAYARKLSKDVETKETTLLEVIWDTGKSGKVTPVAIFEPVVIDDATLKRATLNNVGFIQEMDLCIGDRIIVTRSGGIIPKILGKV
jgi:DNA ligase (NAD+)